MIYQNCLELWESTLAAPKKWREIFKDLLMKQQRSGLDTIRHNIENIKDFKPSKIVQNTISDDKKNADMLEEKPNRPSNNKNKPEHTDSKKSLAYESSGAA